MSYFVNGPLSYKHNGQLLRPGQEVTEISDEDAKQGVEDGVLTDQQPERVAAPAPQVTNPAALHPTAAYGTGDANNPFAEPQNVAQPQQSAPAQQPAAPQQPQAPQAPQAPVQPQQPQTPQVPQAPAPGTQPTPNDVEGI